jgi:DNA modification methylase
METLHKSIIMMPISELRPNPRNVRTHSKKQIRQIANSIHHFGFINPILVDKENQIIAGHGRFDGGKLLGLTSVPCLRVDHLTPAEIRAYMLADNKIALNAGWDEELLALELEELTTTDLEFDISLTGFSIAEIDHLIEGITPEEPKDPEDDRLPKLDPDKAICKPGDLWQLGPHKLICGDALDNNTVQTLMDGAKAQMVFTDPPYNVPIDGNVGGKGAIKHREFAMGVGEMTEGQFIAFLAMVFQNLRNNSLDGSIHFICMDWRHMSEVQRAASGIYSEFKNLAIWVKDNGGMGTFYRSCHELIFVYKNGPAPHINSFELGQHGRYRTNVWEYRGVNTLKAGRMDELELHPTVKPVAMIADAIKDVSQRNGIVLDLFGGSGSTLIAAHKTGRRAYLCELDPIYCDRIIRRWEEYAKDEAELIACGIPTTDTNFHKNAAE